MQVISLDDALKSFRKSIHEWAETVEDLDEFEINFDVLADDIIELEDGLRSPRIEAGCKVVLPDGQVRTIDRVAFMLDAPEGIGEPTGLRVTFTERWSPNV